MRVAPLELLAAALPRQEEFVAYLRPLLASSHPPSGSAEDINRFVDLFAAGLAGIAAVKTRGAGRFGKMMRCDFRLPGPRRKQGRVLGIGHCDTVWPVGTLRTMPWRRENGRLWGPGVFDMKAGLALFVFACRLLRDLDIPVAKNVALWIVPDEEVGSDFSRPFTEAEAKASDEVLIPEPSMGLDGKAKTSRKGVGDYVITARGRAAHAGLDFQAGASAIVELARQIDRIATFTDLKRGLTLNPGTIRGGTRTNVIAEEAVTEIDVRISRFRDFAALDRKMRHLKLFDERCTLEVAGGLNRPPMERSQQIASLFKTAKRIASSMKVVLEESSAGGGSDGNFTAALGIPTLDGIGAVGEGAHAANESILESRIPDRIALLAALIAR